MDEEQAPGDAWILNDPFRGGTHLPDITVVSPVFHDDELLGFAASRAHHADVGAPEPGSMPADSRTLDDEGVVIAPTRLARDGELDRELLGDLTSRMRNPGQREADLRAQLAANRAGAERLLALADAHGRRTPCATRFEQTLDYAERRTRARIAELEDGEYTATDVLEAREGDLELRLKATVRGDEMVLDFTGSAAQHEGNLNCPLAVTLSASYFALRVLTDPDVPPCAGAYRPLEVIAPEGCLLNARVAGRRGRRQRGDLVAGGRPGAGRVRPRPGPGHDEQLHAGQRRLHLLRDPRRRPGRLRGRGRPQRGARGHVQHAEHADRGAGAGVPAAGRGVRGPARLGRRRAATAAARAWCASWRRWSPCATR